MAADTLDPSCLGDPWAGGGEMAEPEHAAAFATWQYYRVGETRLHGEVGACLVGPGAGLGGGVGQQPGAVHDLTAARIWGIVKELATCGLVVLADEAYVGVGDHIAPRTGGRNKPASQKDLNRGHARLRDPGERVIENVERQASIAWPLPVDVRLERLLTQAKAAGERTSRKGARSRAGGHVQPDGCSTRRDASSLSDCDCPPDPARA